MTPKEESIVKSIRQLVRQQFEHEGTGHDWWHIQRVWNMSLRIAKTETCNPYLVHLIALLHDIADHKFHDGDLSIGPDTAEKIMRDHQVDEDVLKIVKKSIGEISFKGADVSSKMSCLEGEIVQDADRLDAIGAIGIARAFAYGGNRNRSIYEPTVKAIRHTNFEDYYLDDSHTINHFYAKLLLLKDRMNTKEGRRIAEHRHNYLEAFLKEFYAEWEAEL